MKLILNKGRQHSGCKDLNYLVEVGNTYIMDNHLAATWCWLQKIDKKKRYNLFHIDRHYDLANRHPEKWAITLKGKNISKFSIDEYTELTFINPNSDEPIPVFTWDTYLPLFKKRYSKNIDDTYFATHKDGNTMRRRKLIEKDIWDLPDNLSYWITEEGKEHKWIVNLDIDYFFTDIDEKYFQFLTDEYVNLISEQIKASMDNIEVLTIALSPEMCGGWDKSIMVAELIIKRLGIDWSIKI